MKNTFAKVFASLIVCLGAQGAFAATKVGSITIPRAADGESAKTAWCRANDLSGANCTDEAFAAGIKGDPGLQGEQGPKGDKGDTGDNVCTGLSENAMATTVKSTTRTYQAPKGGANGYKSTVGGYNVVATMCKENITKTGFEPDNCNAMKATSNRELPGTCAGVIKQCISGADSTAYYMCEESCQSSTSVHTPPTGEQSDENGLSNGRDTVVYDTVGYVTTTVTRGCDAESVATETIRTDDTCTDPKVIGGGLVHATIYAYYTCSYGDGEKTNTYILRKDIKGKGTALEQLTQKMDITTANTNFMSLRNDIGKKLDKTTAESTYATLNALSGKLDAPSGGSAGQVLKWTTGGGVEWGSVSPNVQMTTFTGDTHLYYCGKTNGTCDTSNPGDGWQSVEMSALSGTDGNTGWLRRDSSTGNIEVCYKPTQSSCTTSDWTTLVSGTQIKGDPGDAGASAVEVWCAGQDLDYPDDCDETDYFAAMKGVKGDPGNPGSNGQDGNNGLSAYQIWLSQPGNSGKTEQQFLDSLKGQDGRVCQSFNFVETGSNASGTTYNIECVE